MGCETWPQVPERAAAYRTANETYIVEDTNDEEFCHKFVTDNSIIKAYYKGKKLECTND
jgi:hypothetical protein